MLKRLNLILIFLLTFMMVSCEKENYTFEEFNNFVQSYDFEKENGEVTSDFSLPLILNDGDKDINIKWEILSGDYAAEITSDNYVNIYRPNHDEEDINVTLNATFSYKSYIKKKVYNFKVIKDIQDEIVLNDKYVVYINVDGFAKYYYDIAKSRSKVNNLEKLNKEGIIFTNLRTEFPSITNPTQEMIISGATSETTENVYRYYDKTNDIVIQQGRDNKADTIYKSAVRAGLSVASVRHFPGETVLTPTDLNKLYVNVENGKESNQKERFSQAVKLVRGEEFTNGTIKQKLNEVPRLLSVYVDELDAFGHNDSPHYGKTLAKSEKERIDNVVNALNELDIYINNLVDAYKYRGIYEKTVFLITTDHGMTPFGAENDNLISSLTNKYSKTKWPNLRDKLSSINNEYKFEYIAAGNKPKSSTTVVGVSTGLQMLLTFKNHRLTEEKLQEIKQILETEEYIDRVLTRNELRDLGVWRGANIDLLVIPSERYHFHGANNPNNIYKVRGQHDTMLDSSRNIFGMIFGSEVSSDYKEIGYSSNTQFGSTIADVLGIKLRDRTKNSFDIFN